MLARTLAAAQLEDYCAANCAAALRRRDVLADACSDQRSDDEQGGGLR